ncbi:CPBP family intramembrane glutamic endopeptidase, partial [Arthrospira platensis SPKY1]|nr:CPBP family intramembrane glutamic endopeptidase [Arthrospira platensis SPKY1]
GWHPDRLTPFVVTAMGIGAAEELLFRGYIYGAFSKKVLWAIGLSALAHTLYKTAIFMPYPEMALWSLALLTFLTGILVAWMRWRSGSIWPAVFFHALFDLWVY